MRISYFEPNVHERGEQQHDVGDPQQYRPDDVNATVPHQGELFAHVLSTCG